jgi:hypothetical protein
MRSRPESQITSRGGGKRENADEYSGYGGEQEEMFQCELRIVSGRGGTTRFYARRLAKFSGTRLCVHAHI